MNKKILAFAFATLALVSVAQAKLFIGIEGGYATDSFYETGLGNSNFKFGVPGTGAITDAFKNGTEGFSVKGVIGSESFLGNYFGTRWGLSAGYTSTELEIENGKKRDRDGHDDDEHKVKFNYVDAGLLVDVMLNFYNNGNFSFGVFGGVSADYHYGLASKAHLFDFSGRVGVTTLLAKHHRLEVLATLPIASMNVASPNKAVLGGDVTSARSTVGASYKFVF